MIARSLVAGTVALSLCACGGGDGVDGYSADLRARFVVDCVAQGTPQDQCECLYDGLEEEIPFERYEELDESIRSGSGDIPTDIADLAATCATTPATD
ncbi:MAG TPA: hypothetical protein VK611_27000 [Acidimicrobiales bacterium]|nr:hypothetical protein [Acidimicrobiales bacterium]